MADENREVLTAIRNLACVVKDSTTETSKSVAVLSQQLTDHIERTEIHTVPPCEASQAGFSALRHDMRRLVFWFLGGLASAVASLIGVVIALLSKGKGG